MFPLNRKASHSDVEAQQVADHSRHGRQDDHSGDVVDQRVHSQTQQSERNIQLLGEVRGNRALSGQDSKDTWTTISLQYKQTKYKVIRDVSGQSDIKRDSVGEQEQWSSRGTHCKPILIPHYLEVVTATPFTPPTFCKCLSHDACSCSMEPSINRGWRHCHWHCSNGSAVLRSSDNSAGI